MSPRLPTPVLKGLQCAIALGLLAVLWHVADGARALDLLAGVHPGWLAAALGALTLQTLLSALRWRLAAGQLGIRLGRMTALGEYYLAQLVNQALPGGVIGDAGRAVRSRAQAGLMQAAQAVVIERLAGQVALFAVFATAAIPALALPGGLDAPRWLAGPMIALICAGVLALAIFWRGALWPAAANTRLRQPVIRALAAPEVRARQVWLSLGTALCNIAAFVLCARAVGCVVPVADALVLVPLVLLSMLIPLTIGGWGLREGAAAAILPIAGATPAEALAASVAFGIAILLAAAPGLLAIRLRRPADPMRP